jgi:hypothetical protein
LLAAMDVFLPEGLVYCFLTQTERLRHFAPTRAHAELTKPAPFARGQSTPKVRHGSN